MARPAFSHLEVIHYFPMSSHRSCWYVIHCNFIGAFNSGFITLPVCLTGCMRVWQIVYFIGSLYTIIFGLTVLTLELRDKLRVMSAVYCWIDIYLKFLTLQPYASKHDCSFRPCTYPSLLSKGSRSYLNACFCSSTQASLLVLPPSIAYIARPAHESVQTVMLLIERHDASAGLRMKTATHPPVHAQAEREVSARERGAESMFEVMAKSATANQKEGEGDGKARTQGEAESRRTEA
eukprot:6180908-Pleurochrysis_carterae.AAC.2